MGALKRFDVRVVVIDCFTGSKYTATYGTDHREALPYVLEVLAEQIDKEMPDGVQQ